MAHRLPDDFTAHEYCAVIRPLTVLHRLDCVLEPTEGAVVAKAIGIGLLAGTPENVDPILEH